MQGDLGSFVLSFAYASDQRRAALKRVGLRFMAKQRSGDAAGEATNSGETSPATITKKEIVDRIAERSGCTRVLVKSILQEFLDEVTGELARGNRLEFRDFGVFEVRERAARVAQNPKTLEKVEVPPKKSVRFKAGRKMGELIQNGPDAGDLAKRGEPEIEVKARSKTAEAAKA